MHAVKRIVPALLVAASLGACGGELTLPEISISALVSSVTVDGEPANVAIERGAPPAETAAPVIDATLPAAAINGGSFEIAVSSVEQFSEIVVGMPNVPDYFRVTLSSPRTSAKIVVTLDPGTPGGPLEMFVAGGKNPTEYGPYVTRLLSVMRVGSGDVQVSVAWNTTADLDLHVVDPSGEEVYWGPGKPRRVASWISTPMPRAGPTSRATRTPSGPWAERLRGRTPCAWTTGMPVTPSGPTTW